jgi:hypothetical protein
MDGKFTIFIWRDVRMITKTEEYINARFEYVDTDGVECQCDIPGWVMNEKYVMTFDIDGIFVYEYERRGTEVILTEGSEIAASLNIPVKRCMNQVFNFQDFRNMSFPDFIYRLIEIRRDIHGPRH